MFNCDTIMISHSEIPAVYPKARHAKRSAGYSPADLLACLLNYDLYRHTLCIGIALCASGCVCMDHRALLSVLCQEDIIAVRSCNHVPGERQTAASLRRKFCHKYGILRRSRFAIVALEIAADDRLVFYFDGCGLLHGLSGRERPTFLQGRSEFRLLHCRHYQRCNRCQA